MTEVPSGKPYDLGERTFQFAVVVRLFCERLKKTGAPFEDLKQLIRSSGSVGANYIEANESLSKKDFVYRMCICRKEAKESAYWVSLLKGYDESATGLIQEARELVKIFNAIIQKSS